jgi:hypothetical protein
VTVEQYTFLSRLAAGKPGKPGEPRSAQFLSEIDHEIAVGCVENYWVQWVWCFDGMITPISLAEGRELIKEKGPGELRIRLMPAGKAARNKWNSRLALRPEASKPRRGPSTTPRSGSNNPVRSA